MDADTEETVSKAEELTREVIEHLMPDAGVTFQATSQRAIEATLLKYGRLVQEAAANTCYDQGTDENTLWDKCANRCREEIMRMPLP